MLKRVRQPGFCIVPLTPHMGRVSWPEAALLLDAGCGLVYLGLLAVLPWLRMVLSALWGLRACGRNARAMGETGRIPGFMQQGDPCGGSHSQFAANEKQQHT